MRPSLAFALIATFGFLSVTGLPAQGGQTNPDMLRKEAQQSGIAPVRAREVFLGLQDLVFQSDESADQRCIDANTAILLGSTTMPELIDPLMKKVIASDWLSKASSTERTKVLLSYCHFLINKGRPTEAKPILDGLRKETTREPALKLYFAILSGYAAQQLDDQNGLSIAAKDADPYIDNPKIELWVREEGMALLLLEKARMADFAKGEKESLKARAANVVGDNKDDNAWYVRIVAQSLDLLPLSPKEFAWLEDDIAKEHPRMSRADLKFEAHRRLSERTMNLAKLWQIESEEIANTVGKERGIRSYSKVQMSLVMATMFSPRPDGSSQSPATEAKNMKSAREALTFLDGVQGVFILPEILKGMWIQYYHRTHQPNKVLETYKSIGADRPESRISLLPFLGDSDPELVAKDWTDGIERFATNTHNFAMRDPEEALQYVSSMIYNWSNFESIARRRPEVFLDGYAKATGIIKNVPFKKRPRTAAASKRIYGPVTLRGIQAKLLPDRPMLVFVRFSQLTSQDDAGNYGVFLLLKGQPVRYVSLGDSDKIDAQIDDWSDSVGGTLNVRAGADPKKTGRVLYDVLLGKVFGKNLPKNLLIVPDGKIGIVSFAALRTPGDEWVLNRCTVSYAGAMRDILSWGERPAKAGHSAVYWASQFKTPTLVKLEEPKGGIRALKQLDVATAARPIRRGEFLQVVSPSQLYVSTHGFDDSTYESDIRDLSTLSGLILPGEKTSDQKLTAGEIASIDLSGTRCVVLAACRSGSGQPLPGDGISGLRRSFYIAGAATVVSTVGLAYTAGLDPFLARFYAHLKQSKSPAAALRLAQLDIAKTEPPYKWCGFICEGTP